MIWNAPFTGSMYDALSSVFVCLLQKTPSLSLSDKEGVYSSIYKTLHAKFLQCLRKYYLLSSASILSFNEVILLSASACFLRSLSTISGFAFCTKRSLLSFFCTDFKKPSW